MSTLRGRMNNASIAARRAWDGWQRGGMFPVAPCPLPQGVSVLIGSRGCRLICHQGIDYRWKWTKDLENRIILAPRSTNSAPWAYRARKEQYAVRVIDTRV